MSKKEEFQVLRAHIGDKTYNRGDTRLANPKVVKKLVERGTLAPIKAEADDAKPATKTPGKPRAKTAPKAANKAEPKNGNKSAPANNQKGQ